MPGTGASQEELDAQARRYGYNNWAEMEAFMNQQERSRRGPVVQTFEDRLKQNLQRAKQNVLSLHPTTLLNFAKDRISEARKKIK